MSKCNKGKPCGVTCIDSSKRCRATLPPEVRETFAKVQAGSKRGQGQSLEGSDLDFDKLHNRALTWAKENNLGDPEDVQPGHDETHVLVRDYLGKSAKAIGALIGEPSKGGPTNFEEVLVEAFETLARSPRTDKSEFFPSTADQSFGLSRNLGVLPKDHLYNRDPERAVNVAVKYLYAISRREDFDLFLETVKTARKKALEKYRGSN